MQWYRLDTRKVRRRINNPFYYFVDSSVNPHIHYVLDEDKVGIVNLCSGWGVVMDLDEARESAAEMKNDRARKELIALVNDGTWRNRAELI